MAVRVLVADRSGAVRDELFADVEAAWVLNGIGRAKIAIAASDPKATPENLQPSNRVLIRFENGLPDWGGVIDLPRRWEGGVIAVNAYTIEHILQYRLTDRSTTFGGAPVGAIFARVLREMEAVQSEGIVLGDVWMGGLPHYPRYHYKSVFDVLESIHRMEQCDVVFQPMLEDGRITFLAQLQERWGEDKSNQHWLVEGANVSELSFEEQGPLCNSVVAAGAGTTWTDERLVVRADDRESVQRYGLREQLDVYADVSRQGTLEMHARARLLQAWPALRFGLTVADADPARFGDYDVGDILVLEAPYARWGYRGKVRVIGREWNSDNGVCRLAVDEWREYQQIFIRSEREGE